MYNPACEAVQVECTSPACASFPESESTMPIYEYTCSDCGKRFDTLRPMSAADAPIPCPDCSSGQTKRALSLFCAHGESGVVAGGGDSSCGSCSGGSCTSCGE